MLNLGKTSLVLHGIELTDPTPVWTPPYPIPINQRPVLKLSQRSQILFHDPHKFWHVEVNKKKRDKFKDSFYLR